MGLETGTRIADLVATNPVGATDFVSQGDDHIRLIKAAVQGSFPSLGATAVTASGAELNILDGATVSAAELNILDGATLSTAELNILDGVTLTASQINDAARKSASNSFSQPNTFGNVVTIGDSVVPDSNGARSLGITGTRFADVWTVNLNGVAVTGYARLAAVNQFTTKQMIVTAAGAYLAVDGGGTGADTGIYLGDDGGGFLWQRKNVAFLFGTNNIERFRMNAGGGLLIAVPSSGVALTVNGLANAWTFQVQGASTANQSYGLTISAGTAAADIAFNVANYNGSVTGLRVLGDGQVFAPKIATSTSTTLAAGQLHHITDNATLPALGVGDWVGIVNNSGSAITITENSGDTTYWSTGQVSISAVTLQARGRMIASGAGSSVVYVTGDISGYT